MAKDRGVFEVHIGEPFFALVIKGLCAGSSEPGFAPKDYITRAFIKSIFFDMQGAKSEGEVETMVKEFVRVIPK